jgi:hypothetical protein
VADRLRELEINAIDVNVGSAASSQKYLNKRAEIYCRFRDWLREGDKSLPDDPELISQLSGIKYHFDSTGKLAIEKKENMKKRGVSSPDRADAVVLCFSEADYSGFRMEPLGYMLSSQADW